jgi:hypothetical protein
MLGTAADVTGQPMNLGADLLLAGYLAIPCQDPKSTPILKLTVPVFDASGGASGSRMDREVQEQPLSVSGWGGVHPLAIGQDRPSRLGPAGEGRSDSGVLHLHPRGQARYPEGGRRREDEPQARRVRANTGDDEHQGDDIRGAARPERAIRVPEASGNDRHQPVAK